MLCIKRTRAHAGQVPGNVELDLQRAGLIPDPFYADNILSLRPSGDPRVVVRRATSHGAGSDGGASGLGRWFARDWIPWRPCGSTVSRWGAPQNMLITHRFDVNAALRLGEQRIALLSALGSAVNAARRHHYDAVSMSWEHREEGLFIRKAPHVWGWDIMPRAVSAGIWRSVWLEERPADAIEQLYFWTESSAHAGATLGVRFQFRTAVRSLASNLGLRCRGALVGGEHTFEHVPRRVRGRRLSHPGAGCALVVAERLRRAEPVRCDGATAAGRRRSSPSGAIASASASWKCIAPDARASDAGPGGRRGGRAGSMRRPTRRATSSSSSTTSRSWSRARTGCRWTRSTAGTPGGWTRALALFADLGCNMIRCWGGNVYEDHRLLRPVRRARHPGLAGLRLRLLPLSPDG